MKKLLAFMIVGGLIVGGCGTSAKPQHHPLYNEAINVYNMVEKASEKSKPLTAKQAAELDAFHQDVMKMIDDRFAKDKKTRSSVPTYKEQLVISYVSIMATDYNNMFIPGAKGIKPSAQEWATFLKDEKKAKQALGK
ncbi:MAG: hypothetical protein K6T83_21675 [Alicyclobacillus sp.]|nr:hypothetical protein [Alicyclobacillus sp.]